jgi:Tat protein translocase TatB subunit
MPNIGSTELIVILVVALILLGPKRLPEMGDAIGKTLRKFRQASREIRDEIDVMKDVDDDKKKRP